MICYRDKTFCCSDCVNDSCSRFISDERRKDAQSLNLPFCTADFSDECGDYKSEELEGGRL